MNEFINKVEVQGIIGQLRTDSVGDSKKATISLCVEEVHKSASGTAVVNVTWLLVIAWQGEGRDLRDLSRGTMINVKGHLNTRTYGDGSGTNRTLTEIVADTLTVIPRS